MNRRGEPEASVGPAARTRRQALAAAVLLLTGACASSGGRQVAPAPVAVERADAARTAYEKARQAAYGSRRFKALFGGDVSPRVGAIARGYLSAWWDGRSLVWRASAPLAGAGRQGRLSLDESASPGSVPFPGELDSRDAIGVLLGVLDLPPGGAVVARGAGVRIVLDARGRSVLMDERLRIVGFELPHGASVKYEPGDGVPRRIEAKSPDGFANLRLESFGPWPASEPIPAP